MAKEKAPLLAIRWEDHASSGPGWQTTDSIPDEDGLHTVWTVGWLMNETEGYLYVVQSLNETSPLYLHGITIAKPLIIEVRRLEHVGRPWNYGWSARKKVRRR